MPRGSLLCCAATLLQPLFSGLFLKPIHQAFPCGRFRQCWQHPKWQIWGRARGRGQPTPRNIWPAVAMPYAGFEASGLSRGWVETIEPELPENRAPHVSRCTGHAASSRLPDNVGQCLRAPQKQRAAVIVWCLGLNIHFMVPHWVCATDRRTHKRVHFRFRFGIRCAGPLGICAGIGSAGRLGSPRDTRDSPGDSSRRKSRR